MAYLYSGFAQASNFDEEVNLLDALTYRGVQRLFIVGMTYDYSVGYTALNGVKHRFSTYIVTDATREFDPESAKEMKRRLS